MGNWTDQAIRLLASFLAVAIVLTLHEFSHALAAHLCGDPTPKWNHRLTLNPLRHFDLIGLVSFALVGFGWAKPVPINPNNFRRYRTGLFFTSAAGIITNYLSAFLFYPLYLLIVRLFAEAGYIPFVTDLTESFFYFLFAYSLSFAVFNLLPLYPLDGFRIVDALNKRRGKIFRFLRRYGQYILLGLIAESFLCNMLLRATGLPFFEYVNILDWVMQFAVQILGWPIMAFWRLFL